MRLLPWLTKDFHSPLPPAELLQQIQANVAQPLTWRNMFHRSDEPFRGLVSERSFKISRIISGKNSMLPIIEGCVDVNYTGGSILRLRHRLSWFTMAFAIVWLGIASVGALVALSQHSGAFLLMVAFFTFGALMFTVPFWWEVDKSQPLLTQLLLLEPAL